jgi:ribonuclease PH
MAVDRADGRAPDQIRPVSFTPGYMPFAEGSTLIELGLTRVICTVSVEESVPPFLRGLGVGWLTAEYRMLPRSTNTRTARDSNGRLDGRSTEIQRLIGRSLRAAVDRRRLGERTLMIDCDVLTADGGTRTAAISGAFVALAIACGRLLAGGQLREPPLVRQVAAISAGIVGGEAWLDLSYGEDSTADVDCNAVATERGETVEFQLSSERALASPAQVEQLGRLTRLGNGAMMRAQSEALAAIDPGLLQSVLLPG